MKILLEFGRKQCNCRNHWKFSCFKRELILEDGALKICNVASEVFCRSWGWGDVKYLTAGSFSAEDDGDFVAVNQNCLKV